MYGVRLDSVFKDCELLRIRNFERLESSGDDCVDFYGDCLCKLVNTYIEKELKDKRQVKVNNLEHHEEQSNNSYNRYEINITDIREESNIQGIELAAHIIFKHIKDEFSDKTSIQGIEINICNIVAVSRTTKHGKARFIKIGFSTKVY